MIRIVHGTDITCYEEVFRSVTAQRQQKVGILRKLYVDTKVIDGVKFCTAVSYTYIYNCH